MPAPKVGLGQFVDLLQTQGRYFFNRIEAMAATGGSVAAFQVAVRRLVARRRIVVPRLGFYVIVPLEYASVGSPPPDWFIDPLMAHLGQPYYVGLLSAAMLHGAANQQPQELQVITSMPLRPVTNGRIRIRFMQKMEIRQTSVVKMKTYTGYIPVSTPEATALDLIRYVRVCGGLNNVATVLMELGEQMVPARLVEAATLVEIPYVQRLGYLLELVGQTELADALAQYVEHRVTRTYALRPDLAFATSPTSRRWHLIVNDDVEVDQ